MLTEPALREVSVRDSRGRRALAEGPATRGCSLMSCSGHCDKWDFAEQALCLESYLQ